MSEKKNQTMHSFDYLFLFEMSEKLSQVRKQMSELRGVGGGGTVPQSQGQDNHSTSQAGKNIEMDRMLKAERSSRVLLVR